MEQNRALLRPPLPVPHPRSPGLAHWPQLKHSIKRKPQPLTHPVKKSSFRWKHASLGV
jgi:hypothetical protein